MTSHRLHRESLAKKVYGCCARALVSSVSSWQIFIRFYSLVLISSLVLSCALRQQELSLAYRPGLLDTGIILGSVSSLADETWKPPLMEMSSYYFQSLEDPSVVGVLRSGSARAMAGWDEVSCGADGLANECGRLFAVALPVGRYQFKYVQVNQRNARRAFLPDGEFSKPLSDVYFTVMPNRAHYLGQFQSRLCISAVDLRVRAVRGEWSDEYDRDKRLLIEKYPRLKTWPIEKALIQAPPWLWMSPTAAPANHWPPKCGPYPKAAGSTGESWIR